MLCSISITVAREAMSRTRFAEGVDLVLGEPLRGLVEDEQPRLQSEAHRHLEQALVPVRELTGAAPGALVQPEGTQRVLHPRRQLPLVETQPGAGGIHQPALGRERDVLAHRERPVDARHLKRVDDARGDAVPGRHRGDVAPLEAHGPGARPQPAADHADQRRLARPVRADDGADLARLDPDGDVLDRAQAAEAAPEPLGLEQSRGHGRLRRPRGGSLPENVRIGLEPWCALTAATGRASHAPFP